MQKILCEEDCGNCPVECEQRAITIMLPAYIWEALEDAADMSGVSPGAFIRKIVAAVFSSLTEAALEASIEVMRSRN